MRGTAGGRNLASEGIGWREVALHGTSGFGVSAGEGLICPGNEKRPQQDSTLRTRLRRAGTSGALTSVPNSLDPSRGDTGGVSQPGTVRNPMGLVVKLLKISSKSTPRHASAIDASGKALGGDAQ